MNFSLILFIIGFSFIIIGYSYQVSPRKDESKDIEFIPRNVYDELSKTNLI